MASVFGYHVSVRRFFPFSFALPVLGFFVFVSAGLAQINGAPASVTSPGFGGHAINGAPASVTSVGPRGYTPGPAVTFSTGPVFDHQNNGHQNGGHHHHQRSDNNVGPAWYPYAYPVPVPYAADTNQPDAEDDDANYQGGPTIFDRRGDGPESYVPPLRKIPPRPTAQEAEALTPDSDPVPDPPQPPTVLVFKDGHKLEVGNYAIVGPTLFDLTPGHSRKVPVTDLNLDATQKENDDRGITFRLPLVQGS